MKKYSPGKQFNQLRVIIRNFGWVSCYFFKNIEHMHSTLFPSPCTTDFDTNLMPARRRVRRRPPTAVAVAPIVEVVLVFVFFQTFLESFFLLRCPSVLMMGISLLLSKEFYKLWLRV